MNPGVAWVTGGGTGIGKAVAQELQRDGWKVAITGRRPQVLEETAQALGDALAVPADVSQPSEVERAAATIRSRWGDIHLLVNNAGANPMHTFLQAAPDEYLLNFKSNCLSAIYCTKAVIPAMLASRSGHIVNVSSILGRWASPRSSAYSVSKYALAGLTDSLRQELAGTGIHVMGVYPGFIRTAMTEPFIKAGSPRAKMGKSPEAMAQAIVQGIRRNKREVLFPWYVPFLVRFYPWVAGPLERVRSFFDP
jgi:short-subunit dehydrogenase